MKDRTLGKAITTLLLPITAAGAATAQGTAPAAKEDFAPSSLNRPGQQYPQVNSQGYVRFRIEAPEAKGVKVSLGLGG